METVKITAKMPEPSKFEFTKQLSITCPACGHLNVFNQPYAYHAGFADQGFLYNDDGNLTLVWNAFDPEFERIDGKMNPWVLSNKEKIKAFEEWLPKAPYGGRWRFNNPARCLTCKAEISPPMGRNVYYVLYDGSVVADGISRGEFNSLMDVKQKLAN